MPIIIYVKNFIFSKYHHRLIFSFLICTILPLILMGSVLYSITHKIAGDSILNSIILADDQLNIVNIEKIKSICSTWIFLNLMYNT